MLVQLDALFLGLHPDVIQVGKHHTVSLGHCLELVEQELKQFQQKPAEGARESRKEERKRREGVKRVGSKYRHGERIERRK